MLAAAEPRAVHPTHSACHTSSYVRLTVWLPVSMGPVVQQPSLVKPVMGSVPQIASGPPSTFLSPLMASSFSRFSSSAAAVASR